MTYHALLALLACSLASAAFADNKASAVASDVEIATPTYTLAGSKVEAKTVGDLAIINVSGDSQLRWQSVAYGDVKIASDEITLKAKNPLAKLNTSSTISSAICLGRCKITTGVMRCTCDQIEITSGDQNQLRLSGDVKLIFGGTKLTSSACTIRFSGDSPTIIGEFRVPKDGG